MSFNQSPFQKSDKKKTYRSPQNFVEALKSIGGYTARSVKNDLITPTLKDMVNTVAGQSQSPSSLESPPNNPDWSAEWIRRDEAEREEAKRRRHQEIIATPLYDRHEESIKQQIEAIRKELEALAKEIGTLATSTQKAIEEEIASPGTYHLNFFDKLRKFLHYLRQQVSESSSWLDVSYSRKRAQNVYWGCVGKSGTKFMMSSERYMSTSAG